MVKKFSILIIDDSKMVVDRLLSVITVLENVLRVREASSYEEGVDKLKETDVLLLDINLPGKSGISLLRYIRENKIPLNTIIIISNHADEYYQQLCKSLGAHYFIDKTNDFEQIPEIIKSL